MNSLLKLSSNELETATIERLGLYIDKSYLDLRHNKKDDEFDFTNEQKTFAIEQSSCISLGDIEFNKYVKSKCKGNPYKKHNFIYHNDDIIAYPGDSMDETREAIKKLIIKKNKKCINRLLKEPHFLKIELAIAIPNNPLFTTIQSLKPLDYWILNANLVFTKIYLVFGDMIIIVNKNEKIIDMVYTNKR